MKKFPVWTMSKANKDENEKVKGSKKVRVQTPGPGHYHSKYGNIPNGPQYSMAKKLPKKKKKKGLDQEIIIFNIYIDLLSLNILLERK